VKFTWFNLKRAPGLDREQDDNVLGAFQRARRRLDCLSDRG
jgi:hypothetical protein